MKDTKRRFDQFSFYDRTGIQAHLEKMAARGWMLEKASNYGWQYRRIEPKKLHFAVAYFPRASEFDAGLAEGQDTFQDYCAQAGWQPVAKLAQMQIFCNGAEDPVPLETDAAVQVETVHRAMKKNYLIGQAALLVVALLQLGFVLRRFWEDSLDILTSSFDLLAAFFWVVVLLRCLTDVTTYLCWYRRAKTAAERDGSFVETHSHRRFDLFMLFVVVLALLGWLFTLTSRQYVFGIGGIFVVASSIFLTNLIKSALKRKKASAAVNRTITLASCFVLTLVLINVLAFASLRIISSGRLDGHAETYQWGGITWEVYHDPLPLTVEDLMDSDYDGYSTQRTEVSSPLVSQTTYVQEPRMDALAEPDLTYRVTQIHVPFLYNLCKRTLLEQYGRWNTDELPEFRREYYLEDLPDWGTAEVYRGYLGGEPRSQYLICWPDRILEISFDWEPSPEQMSIAAEKLNNA